MPVVDSYKPGVNYIQLPNGKLVEFNPQTDFLNSAGEVVHQTGPSAFTRHLMTGDVSSNIIDNRATSASSVMRGAMGGVPQKQAVFNAYSVPQVSAEVLKTIIAEAGTNPEAQAAVAAVILNRAAKEGKTPEQIVKAKGQFEGYSNPGYGSAKAAADPNNRAAAKQVFDGVQSGTIADPTNGGTMFHAGSMTPYWAKSANKNGTVNIGGNVFYKGNSSPQTALSAINAVAPIPQPRPTSALGYEPPTMPKVRAISVNPNGSAVQPQMVLPQTAMYGINRLDPNHVTHAPTDFTTQDVGVPEARLSQLSAPFPQPANLRPAVRTTGFAAPSELISRPVNTLRMDPMTNQVISNQPQSLQDALNVYAQRQALAQGGSMKTTTQQAGNVALPPGVVPKQAAADLASITQPNGGAFTGGWGASALLPHTAVPNQTRIGATPSPVLAFNGDQNTGIPSVAAINAATNPFAGAVASGALRLPTVPRPPSPGLVPLTQFNTVNPGSQIVPRMQSGFNSTGLGHILQAANGEPIQGGLLGMLFNPGGLLAGNSTPQPQPPVPLPALLAQQSPDQRGPAALLASNMIDSSGMVTGSGGHSLWGSH